MATGRDQALANPGLVLQLSIGASTVATRRVIANLFYRDVVLRRPVYRGETLETTTRVLAMADASLRPGQPARGKVLLGMTTTADGDIVLDYERCALLPCRRPELPGHGDEIGSGATEVNLAPFVNAAPQDWKLAALGASDEWRIGELRADALRDVVDNATALVRSTHNVAAVHRDATASPYGKRLVYGGHTIALAQASLGRSLSGVVTVLGWNSCSHLAPVFEGDLLSFEHRLEVEHQTPAGKVRAVRVLVTARRADDESVVVLDWTPVVYTT